MRKVYRHRATGGLWVIERGDLGRQVSLAGERCYTLHPVRHLKDRSTGEPASLSMSDTAYDLLHENHALDLVVTAAELAAEFETMPELGAKQNSDIEELVAEYEAECCDFSDMSWVVLIALMAVRNLPDSQSRCTLYALAKHVESTLPEPVVVPD